MITYQDFLQIGATDRERAEYVKSIINDYKAGTVYRTAVIADDYDRSRNTTIMNYQKMITTLTGQQMVDKWATVHRSTTNFFNIFTTQLNQYLIGNGVTWKGNHDAQLGADFDQKLQKLGKAALCAGVAYGFYNLDHVDVFTALEFAPLMDEETGLISAGVRFWQVDPTKPLRATLYEQDGYTDYMWANKGVWNGWQVVIDGVFMKPKKPYTWITRGDAKDIADGTVEILAGESVGGFPIVPLYANPHKQSELIGMREKIDAYDFILNGFEDDLDNAQIYWMITGAGGMMDEDLMQFLDRLRTVRAAAPAEGQNVAPVQVEIPYEARERLLDRLNKQLYRDAMLMNPEDIAGGAITATQIRAAYERQNVKADQYEFCVLDFLYQIMKLAGVDDEPTFTRSVIVNVQEEVQTVVGAAQYLEEDYVTRKILTLLGDGDKADEMLKERDANELNRIGVTDDGEEAT